MTACDKEFDYEGWRKMSSLDRAHACGRYHLFLSAFLWLTAVAVLFVPSCLYSGIPDTVDEFKREILGMYYEVTNCRT